LIFIDNKYLFDITSFCSLTMSFFCGLLCHWVNKIS